MPMAGAQDSGGRGVIELGRMSADDEPAIRAFNGRLAAGGEAFQFPNSLADLATPANPGAALWTEAWVAREAGAIRGGFLLKHERLVTSGGEQGVCNFQLPLSEGVVDRRYAMVGLSIAHQAIKQMDALYCLGMGSMSRPLPRLLQRLGWRVEEVPFYFLVAHGAQFARNIRALRSSKRNRVALEIARRCGIASLGAVAWRCAAAVARGSTAPTLSLTLRTVESFGEGADRIQQDLRHEYAAFLDRGRAALEIKFPREDGRYHRFMVSAGNRDVGWLVATVTDLNDHKQFGDLRLASIVDGLLPKTLLPGALALLVRELRARKADLIVSNQSDAAWGDALRRNIFVRGPSNFILGRSPGFLPGTPLEAIHMNRGDGDGPINL
jgi:hypothetical protein